MHLECFPPGRLRNVAKSTKYLPWSIGNEASEMFSLKENSVSTYCHGVLRGLGAQRSSCKKKLALTQRVIQSCILNLYYAALASLSPSAPKFGHLITIEAQRATSEMCCSWSSSCVTPFILSY